MGSYNLKDNYSRAGHRLAVHSVVVVLAAEVHIHDAVARLNVVGVGHRMVVEHNCSRHVEDMWWVPSVEVGYSRPTMVALGWTEAGVVVVQRQMTSMTGQPPVEEWRTAVYGGQRDDMVIEPVMELVGAFGCRSQALVDVGAADGLHENLWLDNRVDDDEIAVDS